MDRPVAMRMLSQELQQKAILELNENPEKISEYLDKLRQWLQKQPHLTARDDDMHLLSFLRGSKWSFHVATQKIDQFYSMRALVPELFQNRDPLSEELQAIFNARSITPLPDEAGYVGPKMILLVFNEAAAGISLVSLVKALFMSFDVLMHENDNIIVSGFKIFCDYKEVTPKYVLSEFTPSIMKKFAVGLQSVYPMRMKGLIGINVPKSLEVVYNNIGRHFLSTKLQERVRLISESDWNQAAGCDVMKFIPKEYGGKNTSLNVLADEWSKKMVDCREWFLEENNYICDETCRPDYTSCSDNLGMVGSFRQLDID
ncbi:retinol-binding protein pinta-like [Photinus pyralis]|uniref:retinol-binding protein pinta-like n=1 Tax=Photinus pyralis TaxID=7054 RepID=UPI00126778AE|nr:retinol-binding protein pinta-like [Photinus pyralis]